MWEERYDEIVRTYSTKEKAEQEVERLRENLNERLTQAEKCAECGGGPGRLCELFEPCLPDSEFCENYFYQENVFYIVREVEVLD